MTTTTRAAAAALMTALGCTALAGTAGAQASGASPHASGAAKQAKAKAKRQQAVAIDFAAVAGSTPVRCGQPIAGLGTTGAAAQLTDFRFFVSDVKLLRRDGRAVTVRLRRDAPFRVTRGKAAVTLIDLENGTGGCAGGTRATNAFVRGTVPAGDYVGARWTLGVPYALNHTDATTAPAPLNSAAMAWSWQVGRKFTKIEVSDPAVAGATPWAARTFFVHLGSTGCVGNPATGATARCAAGNRAEIVLKRFDPKRQRVAVDVQALTAGNDVTKNGGGAPGCMSAATDPECGPVFGALGLRLAGGGMGDGGMGHGDMAGGMDHGAMGGMSAAAPQQTVFRAIRR